MPFSALPVASLAAFDTSDRRTSFLWLDHFLLASLHPTDNVFSLVPLFLRVGASISQAPTLINFPWGETGESSAALRTSTLSSYIVNTQKCL